MALGAWLRFDAIRRALAHARPTSIIEIGTGIGAMSTRIAALGSYRGVEQDRVTFDVARRRLGDRVRLGDFTALDAGPVDLVCAFEVLEHIEDDVEALRAWGQTLVPGGWLLLSVPANPEYFGPQDVAAGHFRRYTRRILASVLEQSGFEVVSMEVTGAGMGQLLQWASHRIAKPIDASVEERTAASGRRHQPER